MAELLIAFFSALLAPPPAVEVRLIMNHDQTIATFDPIGVHLQPGQTLRWVQVDNYHSVAAYHPDNDAHELRIPNGAKAWDSGILQAQAPEPGSTFSLTFSQEGVYDYYCAPHEQAGMVGRIVVGRPLDGPGTRPFGYAPQAGWKPVPPAAQQRFPSVAAIVLRGRVAGL